MHTFYHLPKEFYQFVKRKPYELSTAGEVRYRTVLAWQALREAGYSADQASRKLGVARASIYRWVKRLRERGFRGLEDDSRRPKQLSTVNWTPELIETVLELREQYPCWGKDKLSVLVGQQGWQTSATTVGRILRYLNKRGLIHDAPKTVKTGMYRAKKRPYALQKA